MPQAEERMDPAVPVDAQNAPTRDLENRRERGFPQRPHASLSSWKEDRKNASHTKFLTLPTVGTKVKITGRRHLDPTKYLALLDGIEIDGKYYLRNGQVNDAPSRR